uniref:PPPDE domain-containing protein n=1 Tax=Musa acuminata subsp. malaccensis TaxID=214687 RepID=A0A804L3J8_MUSAM|nr:PREDICTED: desumoylating isopeptidase 2-like isoform X2 [Musa acuminata subsp. malaccensis]
MKEVVLHVYDVTNSGSEKTNNTILQINRVFKDRIGLGGIFHSAIQVFGDEEWSFGFCEQGSGVFSCPPGRNPMYTYRERIVLGETNCSIFKVNQVLRELGQAWPGHSYDLLSKNCNHFCDSFCERLGVPKIPGWVNRFANAGDTAMVVAGNAAFRVGNYSKLTVHCCNFFLVFIAEASKNRNCHCQQSGIPIYGWSSLKFPGHSRVPEQFEQRQPSISGCMVQKLDVCWRQAII